MRKLFGFVERFAILNIEDELIVPNFQYTDCGKIAKYKYPEL